MTEPIRTVIYVGIAAVVGLVAWVSRPSLEQDDGPGGLVNQPLFPNFKDPADARTLEIVRFDEATSDLNSFEVAQRNGLWVIPSHGDYPADAEQQLRDAASSLIGLVIVDVTSQLPSDHAACKVIEPTKTLDVGDKNIGTLVALQDSKGNDLMRLIVGDVVPGFPELRFVRKPAEEYVYVTKINLDKLPTDFDKWIEKDLLKLSTFDVARVGLKDYSILPTESGRSVISPRMEAVAAWNNESSNWSLESFSLFSRADQKMIPAGLGEQEEINRQKLDDLKNALDDLKIVDVQRKPQGLSEILKAGGDLLRNDDLILALAAFGFVPGQLQGMTRPEIFAANGEVIVDMKDGVQYHLRFGNVSGAETGSSSTDPTTKGKDEVKLNRYLFVTAQLSPHTLMPPVLEPEPAGPAEPAPEAKPAEGAAETKAGDKKPDAAAKPDDPANPDAKKPQAPADPQAAERDRIKRENERKTNEYNDKRKKAEAKVTELNGRFADWYYVISEDVYKKIHLGRTDLIKEGATAKESGFDVDAFRKLEQDGINPAPPAPTTPSQPNFPGGGFQGGFPGGVPM